MTPVHKVTDHAGDVHLIRCRTAAEAEWYVAGKLRARLRSRLVGPDEIERAAAVGIEVETPESVGDIAARWLSYALAAVFAGLMLDMLARAFGLLPAAG